MLIPPDGGVESGQKWHLRHFGELWGDVSDSAAAESDAVLFRVRTYEEFAAFCTGKGRDKPLADFTNETPKYVVPTTLEELDWLDSSLVDGGRDGRCA